MPDHKCFLIVQFGDKFFIDHNIPFGLASASGLQGKVADAMVDIWYSLGIKLIKKWVDDFVLFHFPYHSTPFPIYKYSYDLSLAKHLISPLGVPWHASKDQDFAFNFSYISLFWDLTHKSISLTSEKHTKHLAKITSFIQLTSHSQFLKNDVEFLHVVFESPVWSSLLPPRVIDQDQDQSTKVLIPQKTGPDCSRPLFSGLEPVWTSPGS